MECEIFCHPNYCIYFIAFEIIFQATFKIFITYFYITGLQNWRCKNTFPDDFEGTLGCVIKIAK